MNEVKDSAAGMSPMFILFIVFLILKLTGVIGWSWWWVTSPLWIPITVVLAIVLLGLVVGGIITLFLAIIDLF